MLLVNACVAETANLNETATLKMRFVFDGDPPHRPGGAVAQAWSVAELLRAYTLVEGSRR